MSTPHHTTGLIRLLLAVCIFGSIFLMYYVNVIKKEYVVFINPDGPVHDTP
jgi:hypothetical protein